MTMDETLKFSMQRMTAYQNVEKEHGYNIRHAYGREGHGKGLGSYGCMNKINSVPADGQYHGCPFKHGQRNLLAKVQSWGVKNEKKAKKIVQIAKDGKYQHACACFFEASHDIEDTGTIQSFFRKKSFCYSGLHIRLKHSFCVEAQIRVIQTI